MLKHTKEHPFPLVIVGTGPAAYSASIYASRAQIEHIMISGNMRGGQLVLSPKIENFPGFPSINGFELMQNLETHAVSLGGEVVLDTIQAVDFSSTPFELQGKEAVYYAKSVILATGTNYQQLGISKEQELVGFGVSYCGICDGHFYKKQPVAVIGGGNTAAEEALHLATLASKVILIHRRNTLRADKILQEQIFRCPNISVMWDCVVQELITEADQLKAIKVMNVKSKQEQYLDVSAIFVSIGTKPCTAFLNGALQLDEGGYIVTKPRSTATSVEGVFAAGDVQEPSFKQAIVSAGSGTVAALEVIRYLNSHRS